MPDILSREAGADVPRPAAESAALGTTPVDQAAHDAELRRGQTKKMFETPEDAALTFAEGIADAMSAGFIRQTGDMADLRREANAGWATAGNFLGTAGALVTGIGPASWAAEGGEALGKAAAKTFLRAGDKALLTTVAGEAAAGAALTGAQAFGHQVMDSVIEDREFSGEAIIHEAKLGGILGGAGGFLMGAFGKVASRGDVAAQGGLLGDPEAVTGALHEGIQGYDDALEHYQKQYGALKGFRDMDRLGEVADGFLDVRKAALQKAARAQEALKGLDSAEALSGADDAAHEAYRNAAKRYVDAVREVDNAMRPGAGEYADAYERGRNTIPELNPYGKMRGDLADAADRIHAMEGEKLAKADRELDEEEAAKKEAALHPEYVRGRNNADVRAEQADDASAAGAQEWLDRRMAATDKAPLHPEYVKGYQEQLELSKAREASRRSPGTNPGTPQAIAGRQMPGVDDSVWNFNKPRSPTDIADMAPAGVKESGTSAMETLQQAKQLAEQASATVVEDMPLGKMEGFRSKVRAAAPERAAMRSPVAKGRVRTPEMDPAYVPPEPGTVVEDLPAGRVAGALNDAAERDVTHVAHFDHSPTEVRPNIPDGFNLQDWVKQNQPGRVRPVHEADARAVAAMEGLRQAAGGRMESAGALGLVKNPAAPGDVLGQYVDQIHGLRKAARLAADEGRGVATPLRDSAKDMLKNVFKGEVLGKLLHNEAMGMMLGFAGYGGRLASASGKLARRAVDAVAKFMSSTKIRAVTVAAANYPHAYSERGPIADPVERIQELQFLSMNPEAVKARVRNSAGDLALVAPEVVEAAANKAVQQVQRLAVRAPAIYFDKLGRPLSPPQGKMRDFFEYENALNDPGSILDSIQRGSLTRAQSDALQGWTSLHLKVAGAFMQDPELLQKLDRGRLRVVEMVTGVSLTGATDPMFLLRQTMAWEPPQPAAPPSKAQAFHTNPEGAPLPSSTSNSGRAPGN